MDPDEFDGCYDPYDGDDLEALGQRESWEDSRAEMECDDDDGFEDDVPEVDDGDMPEWEQDGPEDRYLDASWEDRFEIQMHD